MGLRNTIGEAILRALRARQPELRAAGICHLSLFGSAARGEETAESDIDLAVELDPDAEIGLLELAALERNLSALLGRPVDILPEPVEKQRLQARIDRDRLRAF